MAVLLGCGMANRMRPNRATWQKGVTSEALYKNDGIRLPVISIFRETRRDMAFSHRTARNPVTDNEGVFDRV